MRLRLLALPVAVLALAALAPAMAAAGTLDGRVIVVDPGHNGRNWGNEDVIARDVWAGGLWKDCDTRGTSTASGYREADRNWDVALRLRTLLEAEGARVVMTRRSNDGIGPCITVRARIGNRSKADAAVSLHADGVESASATGFHVIVPAPVAGQAPRMRRDSLRLGVAIRDALREHGPTGVSNYQGEDGINPRADLGGLNLSTIPKVFVEIGNMRAPSDAAILRRSSARQAEAEAIAIGLTRYLTGRRA